MEDEDTKNSQGDAPGDLPPISSKKQTRKQRSKANETSQEANKNKKHSLWRNFMDLSRTRQVELCFLGLVALGGIGYLVAYLCVSVSQNRQAALNFTAEHRPKVIVNRVPVFYGALTCEVGDTAISINTGDIGVWLKNIKRGDALGVFVKQFPKFVVEKKIGISLFDDPPPVSDEMCRQQERPETKQFPLDGGQEIGFKTRIKGAMGLMTNMKSISISIVGKPPDVATGPDAKRAPIAKDAIFQFYLPICTYYFDGTGTRYASCKTYRLIRNTSQGTPSFSCGESPITGGFEQVFGGFCEN